MEDGRKNNGRRAGTTKNKVQGEIVKKITKSGSADKKIVEKNYQELNNKEFLKVKPGERYGEWKRRTVKKRIFATGENNRIQNTNGRLRVQSLHLKGQKKELKLNITTLFTEKPFDYMRCYAFTMRWASVRYNLLKDDIELGYFFYEGSPFTKDHFNNVCMQLSTVRGVFSRFYKSGFISNVSITTNTGKVVDTEYFVLTAEFSNVIKKVYEVLSKLAPYSLVKRNARTPLPPELVERLIEMNKEVEETILGIKEQQPVRFRNEEK